MWRQGDILLQVIDAIPENAQPLKRPILATGDSGGHRHRIKDRRTAQLFELPGSDELALVVTADEALLVHPEHATIELPSGIYRVWRQREFADQGFRYVSD